jgi:hypothetical protein
LGQIEYGINKIEYAILSKNILIVQTYLCTLLLHF